MKTIDVIRALGPVDARSVTRDSMLRWVLLFLPAIGLFFRFGVPVIAGWLRRTLDFDLVPYYPLIMGLCGVTAPGLVGTVTAFLLLDQRDDQTLPALLVTPLSLGDYVRYRLGMPTAISVVLSALLFPLAGLTSLSVPQVIATSITAAPLAPIYALFIGSFANNKVQGLALAKVIGMFVMPAILAYFVSAPWQPLLGVFPHYWAFKVFWLFDAGSSWGWAYMVAGLAWQFFVLWLLMRRFTAVLHR